MADEIIKHYGKRVRYSDLELERFHVEGHKIRHVRRMAEVPPSIPLRRKSSHPSTEIQGMRKETN